MSGRNEHETSVITRDIVAAVAGRGRPQLDWSFYLFLVAGIALRCIALNHPLLDAHAIRQCQTAAATESLLEQPGFHLSSRIPWAGNFEVYYLQELPLYNYLVIAIYHLLHNLDVSGKVVTILLWISAFIVLQFIWRRFLAQSQANWANLLFVITPLGVFYGQAFMPEMLVQLLAFAFVLFIIRYHEIPNLTRWTTCAATGLLGCLVKFPEIVHLYLILIILIFTREKMRALIRPRYLVAAAVTIATTMWWSRYMDSINVDPLSFGSAQHNLLLFIGSWQSRFHLVPWAMIGFYLAALVAPGLAILVPFYGLIAYLRTSRVVVLDLWLTSLAVFYLIWFGNAASSQSYYNLVALAPICGLFGIGLSRLLTCSLGERWPHASVTIAILLVLIPALPIYRHLFRQDKQVLAAAQWVQENTAPNNLILFRPNHTSAMIDYQYNPVLAYYGKRPTFVWTINTPEIYRKAALERSTYAVVTLPQPQPAGLLGLLNRFRHFDRAPAQTNWLESAGFVWLTTENGFTVYTRRSN